MLILHNACLHTFVLNEKNNLFYGQMENLLTHFAHTYECKSEIFVTVLSN